MDEWMKYITYTFWLITAFLVDLHNIFIHHIKL